MGSLLIRPCRNWRRVLALEIETKCDGVIMREDLQFWQSRSHWTIFWRSSQEEIKLQSTNDILFRDTDCFIAAEVHNHYIYGITFRKV